MRKIGILTYYWGTNYGTFLQAYTTLKAIQDKFPDDQVELINYKHIDDSFRFCLGHLNIAKLLKLYKSHCIFKDAQKEFLVESLSSIVTEDYDAVSEFINAGNYDLVLVGSDTVLDLFREFRIKVPLYTYWLSPQVKCKKVIFAASSGNVTCEMIDGKTQKILKDSVNKFDLIGIRDTMSYDFIKTLGLDDVGKMELVPDPTFLYQVDHSYIESYLARKNIDLSVPTIGVGLSCRLQVCKEIIGYYKSKGFQIVSWGFNKYADRCFTDLSPFEWTGLFKYFKLTVTDRFHGSIFSLKNGTPVVAIDYLPGRYTEEYLSKIYCLCKMFDLAHSNHINLKQMNNRDNVFQITDSAMKNFDVQDVNQKIEQFTDSIKEFLNKTYSVLN